ncbi:MAG: hypothetical protein WBW03_16870 [Silvibacterium sp.]
MNKYVIAALAILAALTAALAAPAAHAQAQCVPTSTPPCVQTTDGGGTITTEKAPPPSATRVAGAEAAGVGVMIAGILTLDEVLKHWKMYDIIPTRRTPCTRALSTNTTIGSRITRKYTDAGRTTRSSRSV